MANQITFPAEWDHQEAIMLTLPAADTDWRYMLDDIVAEYIGIVKALTLSGQQIVMLCRNPHEAALYFAHIPYEGLHIIGADFNDTWMRDYGPLTIVKNGDIRALDFGFNGWGLKFPACLDNLVNLRLKESGIIRGEAYRNNRDFILEGGSIESDGRGTILTTSRCLQSLNRNGSRSKHELNEVLARRLGASHVLWLDHGYLAGDDTDSHIDTLARLCPDDTIIYTACADPSDEHYSELDRMREQLGRFRTAEGLPYSLVEVPLPSPMVTPQGERLPATYCNYLVTNRHVFVPVYGRPAEDELACKIIGSVYHTRTVVPVMASALVRQHGSLHCATMQVPEGVLDMDVVRKLSVRK